MFLLGQSFIWATWVLPAINPGVTMTVA